MALTPGAGFHLGDLTINRVEISVMPPVANGSGNDGDGNGDRPGAHRMRSGNKTNKDSSVRTGADSNSGTSDKLSNRRGIQN